MEPTVIKYMHYTTQQQVWDEHVRAASSAVYEEAQPGR